MGSRDKKKKLKKAKCSLYSLLKHVSPFDLVLSRFGLGFWFFGGVSQKLYRLPCKMDASTWKRHRFLCRLKAENLTSPTTPKSVAFPS
jgi:hypothetical protein